MLVERRLTRGTSSRSSVPRGSEGLSSTSSSEVTSAAVHRTEDRWGKVIRSGTWLSQQAYVSLNFWGRGNVTPGKEYDEMKPELPGPDWFVFPHEGGSACGSL